MHAIVQYAISHNISGLKISEFDFDPLQAAELHAIGGVHSEPYSHNTKKHGKTLLNDPLNSVANGKQKGLDDEQGKKDRNSYTEDPKKTDHGIMTFLNNISQMEEGVYVIVNGQWVKQKQ